VLLESKLHPPRLHGSLVERSRLLALLDIGLERKLTLLSAPAGFGKTTLVSQWVADRKISGRRAFPLVAWVSLDSADNDPVRFWLYVITACQAFQANPGQSALALLTAVQQPPFEPTALEVVLTTFLNELTHLPGRGVLVLEDYHVIASPHIHQMMIFLLDHLPTTLHLVIITRSEPPLQIVRLRARNELCELHASDLRFSREEMAAFLQPVIEFPVSSQAMGKLDDHLEGWPAGLRLIALKLQGHKTQQEVEALLTTFAGTHRPILEYFVTEVLDAQPEALQSFLLHTSILSRLTGALCDAVTGRNDSSELLEELDRTGLFLEPLDEAGQWYRYHALFAESMQHEASRRLGEDALRGCSLKASQWYERQGMLSEAVEASLRAQDVERTARLIEHFIETQHLQELHEFHTLRRWLEQLPATIYERRPELSLSYAIALIFEAASDRLSPAAITRLEEYLKMAEKGFRDEENISKSGEVFALRSLVAWRQEEIIQAETYARQALSWLPADELPWRSASLSVLGRIEQYSGRLDVARQRLQEARELCEIMGNAFARRANTAMLGEVYRGLGKLHLSAAHYGQVLAEAREQEDLDDIGHTQLGLAQLYYEWNQLEEAERAAQEAYDIGNRLEHILFQIQGVIMLARVQHARGQTTSALQRFSAFLSQMRSYNSPRLYGEVLMWQARFQLTIGNLAAVEHQISSFEIADEAIALNYREQEDMLLVRWLLAQDKVDEACEILERLLVTAQELERSGSGLEIQALMVLAHAARKQMREARQRLQTVLMLAHSEGYLRLFLDEGETMAAMLRTVLPQLKDRSLITYLQTILRAFAQERGEQGNSVPPESSLLIDPLSVQERRVLRLLAAGRSNLDIARELVVSVNTIRTQVQSIYRKLDVNNRVAASEVARQLQLL
jgi:LuxR family maltose regulon positive regulatory protein